MPTYVAFLGHQPRLSLAELSGCLPDFTLKRLLEKQVALFSTSAELKPEFIDQLGGTLFLAKEIANDTLHLRDVPKVLANELAKSKRGKVTFSLRTVGVSPTQGRELFRMCKEKLKKAGKPSRYVGNERKNPQAVVLHENDMITGKQACELTIVSWQTDEEDEIHVWMGRTIGAQDVDAYTKRDMDKPVRDTKVGLLPPKLAQMMLNLGNWLVTEASNQPPATKKGKQKAPKKPTKPKPLTVFDPFCGTGVIPMECLLRGWDVVATDNAQKAVNDCKKNLDWVRKEYKVLKKDADAKVAKHDARKDFATLKVQPDVVVTETSLGPALVKRATQKEAQKLCKDSEALQAAFLQNMADSLPGVPIICSWPVWYLSKSKLQLTKIWQTVADLGYTPVLPHEVATDEEQRSIIYRRPDQYVGREIVLLLPPQS